MRASTNYIQKEESKTIKRKFFNKSARNALALLLSAALLCCNAGGSLALAADLSDSSASSSVSTVESEADESAESSIPPVEVEPEDSSADGSTEAPQPGKDDEVAASKDDDVGADASAVITGVMSAPVRQMTLLAATEAEPDDESGDEALEADPDIDPTADDGSGEGGQAEDVAETEHENQTSEADGNNDAVPTTSISSGIAGVEMSYAADATTSFKVSSLKPGQVWVDKSVKKTNTTESSFEETLAIYANKYTTESEYSTGNYVLVLDTTRSLYNADHSGKLVKAVTKATNDIVVEICKNPLSNVAVVGFSADNRERDKNKNADATTVILGMGNWKKAGKSLLTCDTSDDNECKWYIGATDAAKSSKVASTGKRYISYGTFTQAGVAHAASILKAQKDKADTAGYMLILTDGVPTYGTTKWAANYDVKNAAWQSKSSASIGNGGGADPKAGAYCLMTMQYWNKVLKGQYAEFKMIDIVAIDAITEEPLPGITATVYDKNGRAVFQNISLEFLREYVPAGDYTVKINHVPDRYAYPKDTPITVRAIRDVQKYVIPIEHLGSITVTKYDSDGRTPLKGVTFALSDSSGNTIMTKTTDSKGQVVFIADDKLVAGDYVVTETKTVSGHTLLAEPIRCTIPMVMTDAQAANEHADTFIKQHPCG